MAETPPRDKFVFECMFDEDGNAVVMCFCSVASGVSVLFDRCSGKASTVKQ